MTILTERYYNLATMCYDLPNYQAISFVNNSSANRVYQSRPLREYIGSGMKNVGHLIDKNSAL